MSYSLPNALVYQWSNTLAKDVFVYIRTFTQTHVHTDKTTKVHAHIHLHMYIQYIFHDIYVDKIMSV